jgi:hypothetical protein
MTGFKQSSYNQVSVANNDFNVSCSDAVLEELFTFTLLAQTATIVVINTCLVTVTVRHLNIRNKYHSYQAVIVVAIVYNC